MYAWESADTGEETTPTQVIGFGGKPVDMLSGLQEQHISADVASRYGITGARPATRFLLEAGAEIIIETARFWASRAAPGPDGKPAHPRRDRPRRVPRNVDDNAFTNLMARWNLRRGAEGVAAARALAGAAGGTAENLALDEAESAEWLRAAEELFDAFNEASGLSEQFAGYFDLEDIDLGIRRPHQRDGRDSRARRDHSSRNLKQADVVALLALVPEEFDGARRSTNFHYYEARCAHDSSFSRAMHAMVAAQLGEPDHGAVRYFRGAAAVEFARSRRAVVRAVCTSRCSADCGRRSYLGFGGLSMHGETLSLDPRLPPDGQAWSSPCIGAAGACASTSRRRDGTSTQRWRKASG